MKKHIDSISKNPETPNKDVPPVENISAESTASTAPAAATTPTPETPAAEAPKAEETVTSTPAAAATPTAAADATTPTAAAAATPPTENPDSFETLFPEPGIAISGPPSWIWWVLLIVASAVLGVVAYGLAQGKFNGWFGISAKATPTPSISASAKPTTTPSASAATSATPTATPTASASASTKSSITMRVLNGTKVTGAANGAKSTLEKAGFTVRTIGNANNQDYESTVIYYATGHKADAESVQAALSTYTITLEESTTLANPDMILVVIGKK